MSFCKSCGKFVKGKKKGYCHKCRHGIVEGRDMMAEENARELQELAGQLE